MNLSMNVSMNVSMSRSASLRRGWTVRTFFAAAVLGHAALSWASQSAAPQDLSSDKPPAEVTFAFERPGLDVPQFSFELREDGSGFYRAQQAEKPPTNTSIRGEAAQRIERSLTLSAPMVTQIFSAARQLQSFNIPCASKLKNIADTGKKTLSYIGVDGKGSCIFHYSENKTVAKLTDDFIGIALTLDEGRRLDFLHKYDRLGLDAEMILLVDEVQAGQALELGTISHTLTSIAEDTALIQRVRSKAQQLLDQSK